MIRINLLPHGERRSKRSMTRIFTVASILYIIVLICIYGYGAYSLWSIECQLGETRAKYQLLSPTQEKMQAANAKQQIINSQNALLVSLTNERKSWYAIISHLGVITPPQVWLSELGAGEKNIVKVKGTALTYSDLANFMQKFEQDNYFVDPLLDKAETDAKMLTNFEITVKLRGM